jgi:hypothetical protein
MKLARIKSGMFKSLNKNNQLRNENQIICADIQKIKRDSFNKLAEKFESNKRTSKITSKGSKTQMAPLKFGFFYSIESVCEN